MDQVSPALQFGIDKVESCSWESSSPKTCQSPSEDMHTAACALNPGASPTAGHLSKPEIYSVMMTMEQGNRNGSRDSTAEPLTPANLKVQDSVICKDEGEYSCSANLDANIEDDNNTGGAGADTFGEYRHNQMAAELPPPPPQPQSQATATTTEQQAAPAKCNEICSIPQCLQFGTYIAPEVQDKRIMISLEGAELWHQFYQVGTEMIITKSGRRMFPGIVISVGGLDQEMKYTLSLEFNPVDNARYKYINTKWVNIGKAEAHSEDMLKYTHPESPSTGKHWMSSKISFKKIKVTNNKNHKKGQVVSLNSMHKYQPRVVISKFVSKKNSRPIFTHDLMECTFIGVTAYQNDQVTQLKIDHNPFAKAFRESGSDNDTYGYGMMGSWPPISPLLSPYGPSAATFNTDGQALPILSPSCIPSAGPSPLPQFNSAFCNWETTPPYSPVGPSYRSPFSNPGSLPSPSLLHDHRQAISSRLMAQDSPPISPILYSPSAFSSGNHGHHHLFSSQPSTISIGSHPFSSLTAAANIKPLNVPEMWTQKSNHFSGNSGGDESGGGGGANSNNSSSFESVAAPPPPPPPPLESQVGYGAVGVILVPPPPPLQQNTFSMPKIEPASSPGELHMDVQS